MLKAYKVDKYLVYANKGTEAKLLAAPILRSMDDWRKDVAGWVALRAEREPELDSQVDNNKTDPYIVTSE